MARPPGSTTCRGRTGIRSTSIGRRRGHRLRPHARCSDAVAQYAPPLAKCSPILTPPTAILLWFHHVPWDYQDEVGPHAVGRAGAALRPRRRRGEADASRPGAAEALCRCRTLVATGGVPGHPGKGSPMVARRLHRLFPDLFPHADAGRSCSAAARSGVLRGVYFPYAPARPGYTPRHSASRPRIPTRTVSRPRYPDLLRH